MNAIKNRMQWMDIARGFCMLSIICGHVSIKIIDYTVYPYALTVFFLLTGYMLKNDLSRESLNKRFKRLMVPYFITCFAVIVMDVVNAVFLWKQTDIEGLTRIVGSDLLRSFMASGLITNFGAVELGSRIGAIWFLPATFFAGLFTQILLKYIADMKTRYGISIAMALLAYVSAPFIWLPFSIQSGVFMVPFLLIGYDARQYHWLEKINFKHFLFCAVIFAYTVLVNKTEISYVDLVIADLFLSTACALAASICVIYACRKLGHCKPLEWIGRNSVYFMCVHLFELETIDVWYYEFLEHAGIPYHAGWKLMMTITFVFVAVILLRLWNRLWAKIKSIPQMKLSPRDNALDIAKAILILLMLVGHYTVDPQFRTIVYSFHMVAFVFYSGYCFKPEACRNLKKAFLGLAKSFLVPYAIFGLWYILAKHDGIDVELRTLIFGFSWAKKFFTEFVSVGPVYFILLLFMVRVMYLLIERFVTDEWVKNAIVIGLVFFGMYLGENDWWLPWSLDVALFCLIFYHLGYYFKKYGIMEYLTCRWYLYFVLSSIWAAMICIGGMEIAVRDYGIFGLTVLGAISASVLLYMLCRYLYEYWGNFLNIVTTRIGMSTIYILIVHVALGDVIRGFLSPILAEGHIYYCVAAVLIQVLLGVLITALHEYIRKTVGSMKRKKNAV